MLVYVDFETRSTVDLAAFGAYQYAHSNTTDVLLVAWALDDAEVKCWWPDKWARHDNPELATYYGDPDSLRELANNADIYFVAHNAHFDRHIWNSVFAPRYNFPVVPLNRWLCSQAQAEASCVKGKLSQAVKDLRLQVRKLDEDGKLKKLLCDANNPWDTCAPHFADFVKYGQYDVIAHRQVFKHTRPLLHWEWQRYHNNEIINDTGLPIHVEFAAAASEFATAEIGDLQEALTTLTNGAITSIYQHARKIPYIDIKLAGNTSGTAMQLREATIRYVKGQQKRSFDEEARTDWSRILADTAVCIDDLGADLYAHLVDFLDVCGSSGTTAAKYAVLARLASADGRAHSSYVYYGAGQTGRESSRGAQTHNMRRDVLEYDPAELMRVQDNIVIAVRHDEVEDEARELRKEYGTIQTVLGRCIRSAVMVKNPENEVILSVDIEQGEPRVAMWASDMASDKLELFRQGKDFYTEIASDLLQERIEKKDPRRQMGKIAHLTGQYLGGAGALMGTAKGYGIKLTVEEAEQWKKLWRDRHPWATKFGRQLETAAANAMRVHNKWYPAGKVEYLFHPQLMGGTLLCRIPSGRFLVYREARWGQKEWPDGRTSDCITYLKPRNIRAEMWSGKQIENLTQAIQADVLKYYIDQCLNLGHKIVGHTHDEILFEVKKKDLDRVIEEALHVFSTSPPYAPDLPMAGSTTVAPFYHK